VSIWFGVRERAARIEAVTQRDVAQSVSDFVNTDLLGSIDPEREDPDVKVIDILDRASAKLDQRLAKQPAVRARVMRTLGEAYLNIGRPEQARPLLDGARTLGDGPGGISPDDRDYITVALAECLWRQRDTDVALAILQPALDARRARLGPKAAGDALFAEMLNGLGGLHKWASHYDAAASAYQEALDIRSRVLPADDTDTLITSYNLAGVQEARAKAALFDAYRKEDQRALAAARQDVLKAREQMQAVGDRCAAVLGPDAPTTLAARCEQAYMTNLAGDLEGAIAQYAPLIPRLVKHLSERHWRTLEATGNLADAYRRTNRHEQAASLLGPLVEHYREVRGKAFDDTITVTQWLADSLEKTGRGRDAAQAMERLYGDVNEAKAASSEDLASFAGEIADLYARLHEAESERRWRALAAPPVLPASK